MEMERENLQVKYIRFGLAIESGRVKLLQRNHFASKFQFWMEGYE